MGEGLALAAAVCYGVTHFCSGLLARRAGGVTVAFHAQFGGTIATLLLMTVFRSGAPTAPALAWGAVSGVGTGLGMAFLYRGMSRGRISVVVPISDVNAALLPVLGGMALLGERPPALGLCGMAVALAAIWLVSRGSGPPPTPATEPPDRAAPPPPADSSPTSVRLAAGTGDGLLAGAGIAVTWVALAFVPEEAGLWPFALSRIVSVIAILPLVPAFSVALRVPFGTSVAAGVVGTVGSVATLLFMLATREQLLAVAAVLSALYPTIPVLLALLVLRERLTAVQVAGLAAGAVAISLIALQ